MKRASRRRVVKWLAAGAAGIAVPAVWLHSREAAPPETGGRVLKMICPSFEMNWSPLLGGGNLYSLFGLLYASPMYFDQHNQLKPYVFTAWRHDGSHRIWSFDIRPGLRFSDGSPITAEEVKGSFEVAARPASKSQRIDQVLSAVAGYTAVSRGEAAHMPGLRVLGEHRIEIELERADPIFFMRLASNLTPIVKASAMRDPGGDEKPEWWAPAQAPAVSGPYRPVFMDLDQGKVRLEPNPHFFGPKPKLAAIEIDTVEDAVSATALLKRGLYHMTLDLVTSTAVDDLGAAFLGGPMIPRGQHFWLAMDRPPTDDIHVRRALVMAVDRRKLIEVTFPKGPSERAEQILTALPGVDPAWVPYPHDPAAARAELAKSRYGGPRNLPRIMMVGISNPNSSLAAQFIAEQWRQNLGIERVETRPYMDSYAGPQQSTIQIFRDDVTSRVPDAAAYLASAIHSRSVNARNKMGGYRNPQVDMLLDEALTLAAQDPSRTMLAQQAQRLFREDYGFIPWQRTVSSRYAIATVAGANKNMDWQYVEPWNLDLV